MIFKSYTCLEAYFIKNDIEMYDEVPQGGGRGFCAQLADRKIRIGCTVLPLEEPCDIQPFVESVADECQGQDCPANARTTCLKCKHASSFL